VLGKDDPYLKIGDENDRSKKGTSDYVWALKDINFEVKQGDVLGIIGKNGAGKSTLLKILSKVTSPTTGQLKVKGRIASLLEVGTGFHPELSGRDNIFLNGAILGMTKKEIKSKFDEIVDFSGVERYIDTPVKRYSSGMYVRLAFSVAAHLDPEILIIDEVLAVGDAEFQKKCLGKMKDVSEKDGRTVLFVSHYMPAVLNLCTYAMVLQFGKKAFEGDTEEGINFYLNHKKIDNALPVEFRKDRRGSGLIYCTNVSVLNKELKLIKSVKSGDHLTLKIDYKVRRPDIRSVAFRIQIIDSNHQIICTCNNEHSTGLFQVSEDGSVVCTIPKLPLFGGTYYLNITIFSLESGLLDEVELAKELAVMDGDYFNTGKIPGVKKGVLVSHHWELQQQFMP
jgi:lipopolysaccharide transport system ATP-binding protein